MEFSHSQTYELSNCLSSGVYVCVCTRVCVCVSSLYQRVSICAYPCLRVHMLKNYRTASDVLVRKTDFVCYSPHIATPKILPQ